MRQAMAAALIALALAPGAALAQDAPAPAAGLSAAEILARMDDNNNPGDDQTLEERITVVDVDGTKKGYDLLVQQKGGVKRLITFVSGEMKGTAMLTEAKDSVYVWLPGFKKVRRVAAHNMNQTMAGSDMTNEDSSITVWAAGWEPKLEKQDETTYWLALSPKPDTKSEYARVVHRVEKGTFTQRETHYFDAAGREIKQMINTEPTDWTGTKRYLCKVITVTDMRTGHRTVLETKNARFNTGLKDDLFTVRQLQWGK
jgi:outer membrane lipoprotein-sorting protein